MPRRLGGSTAPPSRYDGVARVLHWLTVALVAAQFAVAWTMPHVSAGTRPVGLVGWHLLIGTAVLAVVLISGRWPLS